MSDAPHSNFNTPPQGLMALAFTDLEGSSALSLAHGRAFETQRETHFALLRAALQKHGGFEVETAGDSLFAVFGSALDAALWALEARCEIENYQWPPEIGKLRVRFGLHVGEPFVSRDSKTGAHTFRGPVTNCAARVMGAGNGGQILLSLAAIEAISPPPADLKIRDLGAHRLKGIGCESLFQLDLDGDEREFPPLHTLLVQRHNLPLPPTPFWGREEACQPLRALLLAPHNRLLSLCAFGGMGKTRLALHLAETLTDEFPDGVWWVSLEAARSQEAMLAAIVGALPLETDAARAPLDQITAFLGGKNALLVLDNTEQIEDAPEVVSKLLAGAKGFKILVTTRHALQIRAEVVREVPPFSSDEATRFFVARALAGGAELDAADPILSQIAARVEGVPLALELAASLTRMLGPRQILERLGDQLQLLRSRQPDLPPRQRALRATMEWSFEMLRPAERQLLGTLAIFAGGFDLQDVEALCNDPDAIFDLEELVRRSLVRAQSHPVRDGENRYSLLESVRTYAGAQNTHTSEISLAHARHFEQKFAVWSNGLRTQRETQALCEAELDFDNARAALRFWNASPSPHEGANLALSFGRILARTGRLREAALRVQTGLDSLESGPEDPRLRAEILLERASAHFDAFEWESAAYLAEQARALFESLAIREGCARALNLRGLVALRGQKESEAAREFFAQAQNLASGTLSAILFSNLGLVAFGNGDYETARAHWESASEVYERENYERGLAESLTNLGVLAQEQNSCDTAADYYRAALQIELRMRGQIGVARALSNLGEVAFLRGAKNAAPIFAAGVVLFQRADSPIQNYTRDWLGRACDQSGESPEELIASMKNWDLEKLGNVGLEL